MTPADFLASLALTPAQAQGLVELLRPPLARAAFYAGRDPEKTCAAIEEASALVNQMARGASEEPADQTKHDAEPPSASDLEAVARADGAAARAAGVPFHDNPHRKGAPFPRDWLYSAWEQGWMSDPSETPPHA